ncbi:MAG TPA: PIN domain-containing protein [Solirubrobacterales bacterium]|nr:PIN domain-containing protein [Solirubrobacterales bacterium]
MKIANPTDVLLLDASVWVAAKDGSDRHFGPARILAVSPEVPVAALDLTLYEVSNALGARRGQLEAARSLCRLIARRCHEDLLDVDLDLVEAALEVSQQYGLTAYDAAYVAAAERTGWTLVSTDIRDLVSKGLAVTPEAADYP